MLVTFAAVYKTTDMKKSFILFVTLSILPALTAYAQEAAGDVKNVYEHDYLVKVGDMAPDFTITFTDGSEITLSSLRGAVVMLQFTASWCGVCRKEMPFIEKDIWQRHKDSKGFVLIGIDRDEPLEKVIEFGRKTGITYPLGLDPNGDIFGLYALKTAGITRNVLIGRDGKIIMLTRLFEEKEFASLVREIDELLK